MNQMILANLVHRPFRTIISVVAVAVEVTLILLIVGIMLGMLNDSKQPAGGHWRRHHGAAAGLFVAHGRQRRAGLGEGCRQTAPAAARHRGGSGGDAAHHFGHGRGALRHRSAIVRRGERRLPLSFRRPVSGPVRHDHRRPEGRLQAPQGRRHHGDAQSSVPHLRHRRARQGRARVRPHRYPAGPDRRHRQGDHLLRQARRSQQRRRSGCTPSRTSPACSSTACTR